MAKKTKDEVTLYVSKEAKAAALKSKTSKKKGFKLIPLSKGLSSDGLLIVALGTKRVEKYFNGKVNDFISFMKTNGVKILAKKNDVLFRAAILKSIMNGDESEGYTEDQFNADYFDGGVCEELVKKGWINVEEEG